VRANNLFIFFTCLVIISFICKVFKIDAYEKSVRDLGVWGSKYRCFYAIYYPTIAFICASSGGFKGYGFALIWVLSGGTYLVIADKIAREENEKQEKVAKHIESQTKDKKDKESGCPYCKSRNYKEVLVHKSINQLRIKNTCNDKDCGKDWTEVYDFAELELKREDLPIDETMGELFGVE